MSQPVDFQSHHAHVRPARALRWVQEQQGHRLECCAELGVLLREFYHTYTHVDILVVEGLVIADEL